MPHTWPHALKAFIFKENGNFLVWGKVVQFIFLCKMRTDYLSPAFSEAQNRAELRRHPCILGGPKQQGRGQNQKWVLHPCLLGGPKEGGIATSLQKSRVSPAPSAAGGGGMQVAYTWPHRLQAPIFEARWYFFFAVRSCNCFWRNI